MIILKPITTSQSFKIIPTRGDNIRFLTLRNETTNEVLTFVPTFVASSYYFTITASFTGLKEGNFYEATFTYFDTLVHRDRIFCTNQTIANYTINKDEYIASTDNIIFYE